MSVANDELPDDDNGRSDDDKKQPDPQSFDDRLPANLIRVTDPEVVQNILRALGLSDDSSLDKTKDKPSESDIPDDIVSALLDANQRGEIEILARHVKQVRRAKEKQSVLEKEGNAIKAILTEFFDTFVVLGFNTNGQRIYIQHTPVTMHADAIHQALGGVVATGLVYRNAASPDPHHGESDNHHPDDDADYDDFDDFDDF